MLKQSTPVLAMAAALAIAPSVLSGAVSAQEMTPVTEMPAGTYVLDPSHASLHFKVSHIGLSQYTARFTDFSATLDFDPNDPTNSKLTATVNPASIETDYPYEEKKDFDKKLATSSDWFNVGNFPEISFVATGITKTGGTTGTITGDLGMLGVTRPMTLDVTFNGAMATQPFSKLPTLGFSATGTIKRADWGFDTYVPGIGNEVTLLLETEFQMKK